MFAYLDDRIHHLSLVQRAQGLHVVQAAGHRLAAGQAVVVDRQRVNLAVVDRVLLRADQLLIAPAGEVVGDVVVHGAFGIAQLQLERTALPVAAHPKSDALVPGQVQRRTELLADGRPAVFARQGAGGCVHGERFAFASAVALQFQTLRHAGERRTALVCFDQLDVGSGSRLAHVRRQVVERFQHDGVAGVIGRTRIQPRPRQGVDLDAGSCWPRADRDRPTGLGLVGGRDFAPRRVHDALERFLAFLAHQPVVAAQVQQLLALFGRLLAAQLRVDAQPFPHRGVHSAR